MSAKETSGFKLMVVVGVGAVIVGLAVAKAKLSGPTPTAQPVSSASVSSVATAPSAITSASAPPVVSAEPPKPTTADRAALLEAAAAGDLPKVQALHEKGVSLSDTLAPAARSGKLDLVRWLLDHGVDPHEDEDAAVSPLLEAEEHEAIAAVLLSRGVKEPTLLKAIDARAPKTVARLLASKKVDPNTKRDDGEPALHAAIGAGDGAKRTAIVKALLDAGAKAEILDGGAAGLVTETALDAAIHKAEDGSEGAVDVVKLLAAKTPIDRDAMMIAAGMHSTQRDAVMDALLGGRITPDVAYRGVGVTRDPKLVAKIAAKSSIAWNTKDPYVEEPPLTAAAAALNLELVQALLAANAPADGLDDGSDTPLLAAIAAGPADAEDALKIVNALLAKGANVNRRAKDGRRPLHLAAGRGQEAIVKALVAKGARLDDEVNGTTPLEAAEDGGHQDVAKLLIAKGAKKKKPAP